MLKEGKIGHVVIFYLQCDKLSHVFYLPDIPIYLVGHCFLGMEFKLKGFIKSLLLYFNGIGFVKH